MPIQPIVNRNIMLNIISLADFCYHKGVEDMYYIGDEGLAREFLEKTSQPGIYGFLNENGTLYGWQEFTLRLMAQARLTSWNGAMNNYFIKMGRFQQNYLSVFIPCAMAFIRKGINDCILYGRDLDISKFNAKRRVFLTGRGFVNISHQRYVDELQLYCFDLQRRDEEIYANNTEYEAKKLGALKPRLYELFRRAIGLVLFKKH